MQQSSKCHVCLCECILYIYANLPEVAVPDEEAHRHEPPIPHDEVQIEKRKNQQELNEAKNQAAEKEEEELAEQGAGQQQETIQDKAKNEVVHKDIAKVHVAQDQANEIHGKVEEQKQPELAVVVRKSGEEPSLVKEQEADNRLPDKKLEESNKKTADKRKYLYTTVENIYFVEV